MDTLNYFINGTNTVELQDAFKSRAAMAGIQQFGNKFLTYQEITDDQVLVGNQVVTFFNANAFIPEQDEHMLIVGLKYFEGANATLNATDWIPGSNDALAKNGSISITLNNSVVLEDLPINSFVRAEEEPYSGQIWLPRSFFWVGQQRLTLQANFPTAPATANLNGRFGLVGLKLI